MAFMHFDARHAVARRNSTLVLGILASAQVRRAGLDVVGRVVAAIVASHACVVQRQAYVTRMLWLLINMAIWAVLATVVWVPTDGSSSLSMATCRR